jgi:hypothetical protein
MKRRTFSHVWYARYKVRNDHWCWDVFDMSADVRNDNARAYGYAPTAAADDEMARHLAGPGATRWPASMAPFFHKRLLEHAANRQASRLPGWCARLGLTLPCGIEEVKSAYRRLAKTAHPDAGGTAADFVAIERAYRDALAYWHQPNQSGRV